MLYVITEKDKEYIWHVGERPITVSTNRVVELQADGDELELIHKTIKNIPCVVHQDIKVMNWYGDHAKFISRVLGITL